MFNCFKYLITIYVGFNGFHYSKLLLEDEFNVAEMLRKNWTVQ